jgi:hypothetical protein
MIQRLSATRKSRKTYYAHRYKLTVTLYPEFLRTGLVPTRYPAIQYVLQPIEETDLTAKTRTAVHWYPTLTCAHQVFEALQPQDLQTLLAGVLQQLPEDALA